LDDLEAQKEKKTAEEVGCCTALLEDQGEGRGGTVPSTRLKELRGEGRIGRSFEGKYGDQMEKRGQALGDE